MLKTKEQKTKLIIAVALFLVIFGVLLTFASLYDYRVSEILATKGLENGERYISNNLFALIFEAIGSCPIYLAATVAGCILYWFFMRYERLTIKAVKCLICTICGIIVFVGYYLTIKDIFVYVNDLVVEETGTNGVLDGTYAILLSAIISLPFALLTITAWGKIKPENNNKLLPWICVLAGTAIFYLIIELVKSPVGRARFRTILAFSANGNDYINAIAEELNVDSATIAAVINGENISFRNWWITYGSLSSKFEAVGIGSEYKSVLNDVGLASDICKSFPSGHTFSAGMTYVLFCVPDLIESCNTKGKKVFFYGFPILWTGVVALSRIVMGAHYFSDVLIGGTIAFLASQLFRLIFIKILGNKINDFLIKKRIVQQPARVNK